MVNVKGKWALITGASRGIGYLTSIFMAKQGCNLVLHSRKKEHTTKVIEEVKALGVEAIAVSADLSDLAEVEKMLQEIDALDIDEAHDRVIAGPAKKDKVISKRERNMVAYHEAGHTVVGMVLSDEIGRPHV